MKYRKALLIACGNTYSALGLLRKIIGVDSFRDIANFSARGATSSSFVVYYRTFYSVLAILAAISTILLVDRNI